MSAAIGQPVASVDFFNDGGVVAPLIAITCGWQVGLQKDVYLQITDLSFRKRNPPFLIQKYASGTPIDGLGQKAYSMVEGGSNLVAWETRFGTTERTLLLYGYTNPMDALIGLAKQIASGAEPGSAPLEPGVSVAPADSGLAAADVSALHGTWLLAGSDKMSVDASSPPITITLGADGTAVMQVSCKPAKKRKAPTITTSYTATASSMDVAQGTWNGSCKGSDQDYVNGVSFLFAVTFTDGAWSVSGDTLTVTGDMGPVTFQQVTAP